MMSTETDFVLSVPDVDALLRQLFVQRLCVVFIFGRVAQKYVVLILRLSHAYLGKYRR